MIQKYLRNKKGFTLIELLIVIAIIAILAAIIITALNPLKRFRDSRDARRWSDAIGVLNAVIIDQVDNGGLYIEVVSELNADEVYMIGTAESGCDDKNENCIVDVESDSHCVNLDGLTDEGYLGRVPVAPTGEESWSYEVSGYTLERTTSQNIIIRACETESNVDFSGVELDISVMH